MSRVAIVAALPREIAGLVRGAAVNSALKASGVFLYTLPSALVVAAGMGQERATAAVAAALAQGEVDTLISAGLAGASAPLLHPGDIAEANTVVDVRTGERYETTAPNQPRNPVVLASTSTIASVHEKARLAQTYGAALVDMEAATVARLARAHGLRFRAIKGISDAHDFELASLSRFEGKHGAFRTGRFALHTALRPHHWRRTLTLGRHSVQALAALDRELRVILASVP